MKRFLLSTIAALSIAAPALADDFTPADPGLTLDQLKTMVVGNSWSYEYDGATIKEYADPNGELRGESSKDGKYTAHWKLRDDGLFCFDYGNPGLDPGQDGCAQILLKGDKMGVRRLDGLLEVTGTFAKGNAFGL